MEPVRPIDCLFACPISQHGEACPPDLAKGPTGVPCQSPSRDIVANMERYGIDRVLLTPCRIEPGLCDRQYLCDEAVLTDMLHDINAYPQRFSGLAGYNPFDMVASLRRLGRSLRERDLKGLYVHTGAAALLDRRMYPAFAICAELQSPVMVHSDQSLAWAGNWPLLIDVNLLATDFPELRIVVACVCWPQIDELRRLLEHHENVYVALDANPRRDLRAQAAEFLSSDLGLSRCLWGSNGCCWDVAVTRLDELNLAPAVRTRFSRENAVAVYGLEQQTTPKLPTDLVLTAE
jgi:hypothetical protein